MKVKKTQGFIGLGLLVTVIIGSILLYKNRKKAENPKENND